MVIPYSMNLAEVMRINIDRLRTQMGCVGPWDANVVGYGGCFLSINLCTIEFYDSSYFHSESWKR